MNTPRQSTLSRHLALFLGAAFVCGAAVAGTKDHSTAQAQYQKERAACMSGTNQQDRKTCLYEAESAYNEAKKGMLGDRDSSSIEANARKRCETLPTTDRLACLARMDGKGVMVGTVESGGIYRELTTVEPAKPAATAPTGESNNKAPNSDEQ